MNFDNDFDDRPSSRRGPKHATKIADEVGQDIMLRLAARQVRRRTGQHACTAHADGVCPDPNHRRDVDFMGAMLDSLGLTRDYPEVTAAEGRTVLRWIGQSGPSDDGDSEAA